MSLPESVRLFTEKATTLPPKNYSALASNPTDIEPNELADRYEATKELYVLLEEVINSIEKLEKEGDVPIAEYFRGIGETLSTLGSAQKERNDFTMGKYRELHSNLPTLETYSFTEEERVALMSIDAIEREEEATIPVDDYGDRLPLLVTSPKEVKDALETLEGYKQYISEDESTEGGATEAGMKLLHVADTHLGFSNRDKENGEGIDCEEAFKKVGKIAIQEDVDAVVHAGDIFDDDVGGDFDVFENVVEDLRKNGIEFYYILGNHDANSVNYDKKAVSETMEMQERGEINLLSYEPEVLGDGVVALYGVSHVGLGADDWRFSEKDWDYDNWSEDWWKDPDLNFEDSEETPHRLLCLHGDFTKGGSDIPAREVVDRANVDFDKLLLGHTHRQNDSIGGYEGAHDIGPTQETNVRGFIGRVFEPRVNIFEFHSDGDVTQEKKKLATTG